MSAEPYIEPAPVSCLSPGERDDSVAAWKQLAVTFFKLQHQVEDMLAPHGLVLSQFEALAKIGLKPGMIQQELVSLLLVTKGNVGALLDRLQSIELVERREDPNDRRANRLYLTKAGESLITEIFGQYRQLIRDMFKPLSVPQRQTLESLLKLLEPV